jgi:hypothetical protein
MRLARLHEQRKERQSAVIDAMPAHAERLFPLRAIAIDDATAAADTGVVEQDLDSTGVDIPLHVGGK